MLSGFFLKKKPPCSIQETARELENCSSCCEARRVDSLHTQRKSGCHAGNPIVAQVQPWESGLRNDSLPLSLLCRPRCREPQNVAEGILTWRSSSYVAPGDYFTGAKFLGAVSAVTTAPFRNLTLFDF
jgi:hypothetical protein